MPLRKLVTNWSGPIGALLGFPTPPRVHMETNKNKKLIEEHQKNPHPTNPTHTHTKFNWGMRWGWLLTFSSHIRVSMREPSIPSISLLVQTPSPLGSNCFCAETQKQRYNNNVRVPQTFVKQYKIFNVFLNVLMSLWSCIKDCGMMRCSILQTLQCGEINISMITSLIWKPCCGQTRLSICPSVKSTVCRSCGDVKTQDQREIYIPHTVHTYPHWQLLV